MGATYVAGHGSSERYFGLADGFEVSFWAGIAAAKDNLLVRLRESLRQYHLLNPLADLLMIAALFLVREVFDFQNMDFLLVPFLIISCVDLAHRLRHLRAFLLWIGAASTTIWLSHTFFCYYFEPTAHLIAYVHWAVPALILLLLISRVFAIVLELFWKGVGRVSAPLRKVLLEAEQRKDPSAMS